MEESYIYSGQSFSVDDWKHIKKHSHSYQDSMLYILGDTKYRFSCKGYKVDGKPVILDDDPPSGYEELTESHNYEEAFPEFSPRTEESTTISLISADAIDVALVLSDLEGEALSPALLNMAAPTNPGGKYNLGEKAQEEMIFYRSNMWTYLDPAGVSGKSTSERVKFPHYPIPDVGGLYTQGVTFIRGSEDDMFRLISPRKVDVVSAAALKFPALVDGVYSLEDREKMSRKIRAILSIA